MVSDEGPGFAEGGYPVSRGASGAGFTGLGLDIARRIADSSGGSLTIGRSARGGGAITLALGATAAPRESDRRHGIIRHRAGRARQADPRQSAELSEWSAIVGHDLTSS